MNDKKISFIICVNDECFFYECKYYIDHLIIPAGYSIEIKAIYDAMSMTAGYNKGMKESDAKYKVYLHQDVFIINRLFLQNILDIFESDPSIGMIGMVGTPCLAPDALMWHSDRYGNLYSLQPDCADGLYDEYDGNLIDVECVDGLLIATSEDIPWQDSIFDGWDFYDISQGAEFRNRGFRCVVPEQKYPWSIHEDDVLNMWRYNKYRNSYIKKYMQKGEE